MEAKSGTVDVPGGHVVPGAWMEVRRWHCHGGRNHEVSSRPPCSSAAAPGNSPSLPHQCQALKWPQPLCSFSFLKEYRFPIIHGVLSLHTFRALPSKCLVPTLLISPPVLGEKTIWARSNLITSRGLGQLPDVLIQFGHGKTGGQDNEKEWGRREGSMHN